MLLGWRVRRKGRRESVVLLCRVASGTRASAFAGPPRPSSRRLRERQKGRFTHEPRGRVLPWSQHVMPTPCCGSVSGCAIDLRERENMDDARAGRQNGSRRSLFVFGGSVSRGAHQQQKLTNRLASCICIVGAQYLGPLGPSMVM